MFATFTRRMFVVEAFLLVSVLAAATDQPPPASWTGLLRDDARLPVSGAVVELHGVGAPSTYSAVTAATGSFRFDRIEPGTYSVSVKSQGKTWTLPTSVDAVAGAKLALGLELSL